MISESMQKNVYISLYDSSFNLGSVMHYDVNLCLYSSSRIWHASWKIFEESIWKDLYNYSLSGKIIHFILSSNITLTQRWISFFSKKLHSPFGTLSVIVTPLFFFPPFQVPSVQNQDTQWQSTHFNDTFQGTLASFRWIILCTPP